MTEAWAIIIIAGITAGNIAAVALLVKPLTQAVKAQQSTIDAAKALNELTRATLETVRPHQILKDVDALQALAARKAEETVEAARREAQKQAEADVGQVRSVLEKALQREKGLTASFTDATTAAMWLVANVDAPKRRSVVQSAQVSQDMKQKLLTFVDTLEEIEANIVTKYFAEQLRILPPSDTPTS
jgi:hypothetical protein